MSHALALQERQIVEDAFLEHYRCPEEFAAFSLSGRLSEERGFFRFGAGTVCHGRSASGFRAARATDQSHDVMEVSETVSAEVARPLPASCSVEYTLHLAQDNRRLRSRAAANKSLT